MPKASDSLLSTSEAWPIRLTRAKAKTSMKGDFVAPPRVLSPNASQQIAHYAEAKV